MYLSLVIPVYNYEKYLKTNIEKVLAALGGSVPSFEIILVNDGSRDGSLREMKELVHKHRSCGDSSAHLNNCSQRFHTENPGDSSLHFNNCKNTGDGSQIYSISPLEDGNDCCPIKIVNIEKNMGKGHAVKRGVEEARGEYIFFTDVDLPYGIEPVIEGCRILENGQADMVTGSRDMPSSMAVVPYGRMRKLSKRIFSILSQRVTKLHISDSQCGMKGFTKSAAHNIFPRLTMDRFSFDVEIFCIARINNYRIHLIPVNLNHSPTSTVRLLKDSFGMLLGLVSITANELAGKYGIKDRGEGL